MKSFLKWAGGKSKLVSFISDNMPKKRGRLIEPFAGSAALSMALEFEEYVLNDSNQDLMNLYRTLKVERYAFIDFAKSFFTAENNQEEAFYEFRHQFNASDNIPLRSALFIYLNRHAFNGLCRYNLKGQFNVPFGRYKKPYFPEKEMRFFIEKSHRFQLMSGDFQAALCLASIDDIIYCDPPYAPLSPTASFTSYAKNDFNLQDQERLAQAVRSTYPQSKAIAISNHDTDFTRKIYHDARLETLMVQRNIAAKGSSRQKVGELLAIYEV